MAARKASSSARTRKAAASPKTPTYVNPTTDWVPGTTTADGYVHIWWHSYFTLASKPRAGGGRDWLAICLDGKRFYGASTPEVEAPARSYGRDNGLIAKARELKVAKPEGADTSKAPAGYRIGEKTPAPAPAKKAPAKTSKAATPRKGRGKVA